MLLPEHEMGAAAVEGLLRLIEQPGVKLPPCVLPCTFLEGGTLAPAPAGVGTVGRVRRSLRTAPCSARGQAGRKLRGATPGRDRPHRSERIFACIREGNALPYGC